MIIATVFACLIFGWINASCPEDGMGWMHLGPSCYMVSLERMSWYQAQEFCWGHGGYLAEIRSAEEEAALDQALIHDILYWIGLTDAAVEGKWVWAQSHEQAEYFHWASDEPDNASKSEDCVMKSYIGWSDQLCDPDQTDRKHPIHALCQTYSTPE